MEREDVHNVLFDLLPPLVHFAKLPVSFYVTPFEQRLRFQLYGSIKCLHLPNSIVKSNWKYFSVAPETAMDPYLPGYLFSLRMRRKQAFRFGLQRNASPISPFRAH